MVRGINRVGWASRRRDTGKSVMSGSNKDRARVEEEVVKVVKRGYKVIIKVIRGKYRVIARVIKRG